MKANIDLANNLRKYNQQNGQKKEKEKEKEGDEMDVDRKDKDKREGKVEVGEEVSIEVGGRVG